MRPYCSQEVWNDLANRDGALRLRGGVEDLKGALHLLADVEQGSHVAASVAVVRSRPDGHEVGVLEPIFESIHDELMSTGYQIQVINLIELSCDSVAEKIASSSW